MSEMKDVYDKKELEFQEAVNFLIKNPDLWKAEVALGNTEQGLWDWAFFTVEVEGSKTILDEWRKKE